MAFGPVPAGQGVQEQDCAGDTEFSGQERQLELLSGENSLAKHGVQPSNVGLASRPHPHDKQKADPVAVV